MKAIIFFLMIMVNIPSFSQNVDSVGYLSLLKGNGLCIRKGIETNLKIPFYFLNGDRIKMNTGNAVVVLFSEEEVQINKGESRTLAYNKLNKSKNSDLLMYMNTKQSNSSFKIRGIADPKVKIFPLKSKIIDPSLVTIHVKSQSEKHTKYFFKLMKFQSQEVVYQLSDSKSDSIKLQFAPIEKGTNYIWKIKYPEYEITGELSALSDDQIRHIPKFTFSSRASYMEAYNYYYKELLIFEAYKTIENAIKAYQEDMYFEYIKSNMFW